MNEMKRERIYYRCILLVAFIIICLLVKKGIWGTKEAVWNTSEQLGDQIAALYGYNEEEYMQKYVSLVEMIGKRMKQLSENPEETQDVNAWLDMIQSELLWEEQYENLNLDLIIDGKLYTDLSDDLPENYNVTKDKWYKKALEAEGKVVFSDLYLSKFNKEKVITIAQIDPETRNGAAIDIYQDQIEILCSKQEVLGGEYYFLCDSQGSLVYQIVKNDSKQKEQDVYAKILYQDAKAGIKKAKIFDDEKVRIYSYTNFNGWMSIVAMSEVMLDKNTDAVRECFVIISLGLALLLFLVFLFNNHIVHLDKSSAVVDTLGEIYFQIYYISLEDKSFIPYRDCGKSNKKIFKQKKDATSSIKNHIKNTVSVVDQLRVQEFMDLDTLASRLVGEKNITCDYVRKDIGWCRGYFIPLKKDKNGKITEVLYITSCIEEEKKKEAKMLMERNELAEIIWATSRMFDRFCIVNFVTNSYTYSYMKNKNLYKREKFSETGKYTDFVEYIAVKFQHPDIVDRTMEKDFSEQEIKKALSSGNDMTYIEFIDTLCENRYLGVTIYCLERKNKIPTKVLFATRDLTLEKEEEFKNKKKLKEANEALQTMAMHDQLTGLYNRNALQKLGEKLSEKKPPVIIGLMILDVDNFKHVNDTWGHKMGDKVLKKVAELLKKSFREQDTPVRLGGDEFLVILQGYREGDYNFVEEKVKKLNDILMNPKDDMPPVSLSVGVAFSETAQREELYQQADKALYEVKEHGRCGCKIYGR